MYKFILLMMACYFFISTSCSASVSKTPDSHHLQPDDVHEKEPIKGNDSLMISGEDGKTATCSLLDDKKFYCTKYDNSKRYAGFIKDYLPTDKKEEQYVYFLNDAGSLLNECQFNIRKKGTEPDIGSCHTRDDIRIPVKILTGKVLSEINSLLLLGEDSEVYQCSYNRDNVLTGCYPTGMKNFTATEMAFDPLYHKIYFYSAGTDKIHSCDVTGKSIDNCSTVNLNTDFPDKNIRHVTVASDGKHMLLSEQSILHYCEIDNEKLELNQCVNVYDKFRNLTSLAYSKNNDQVLYAIDDHMIESCHFDDIEVHCHKLELNHDIETISANTLSTTKVFTFFSVKVKNLGGYSLSVWYRDLPDPARNPDSWKLSQLLLSQSANILVKGGSGIQFHAMGGQTKCFMLNKAGELHCSRGIRNMACYYNGSSKTIINEACPLPALSKNMCSAAIVKYARTSGEAEKSCSGWKVSNLDNTISCWSYNFRTTNSISCYAVKKAMRFNKKIRNRGSHLAIE